MFLNKIVVAIFICVSFIACHSFSSAHKPPSTLTIGVQTGYPPFEFRNKEGQLIGFDLDLAQIIATKMGKELMIADMEFEGLILALKQGKIDLIMSGMNITKGRLKEISMVSYHGDETKTLSLIFWNKIPLGILSIEDFTKLPDASISVESGTIPEQFLSRHPEIKAKSFQGALAPLMDVKMGKSTANLVESAVANYLKTQHPEIQMMPVTLEEEDENFGFGIGIKKENWELAEQVADIISELKISGKLQQLEEHWFVKGGSDDA